MNRLDHSCLKLLLIPVHTKVEYHHVQFLGRAGTRINALCGVGNGTCHFDSSLLSPKVFFHFLEIFLQDDDHLQLGVTEHAN